MREGMNRILTIVRVTAYFCGIVGAALFMVGRSMDASRGPLMGVAGMLLLAMFCLFLVSYALHFIRMTQRRNAPPRWKGRGGQGADKSDQ
jgi:hypothetical protein